MAPLAVSLPFSAAENEIYRVIGGSHTYGTSHPASDVDLRAVVLPPPAFVLGMHDFDAKATPEGAPVDQHVYSLRRFVRLAANCSVPILEMLFVPPDCIVRRHGAMVWFIRNRHVFLSRRLYRNAGGYAFSTAIRAFEGKAHKGREHLLREHGYDTKAVMHAVRLWRMAAEAFAGGDLAVRRLDAPELLAIREGSIPKADVARFEGKDLVGGFLAQERDRFEATFRATRLPEHPDEGLLSSALVDAHLKRYELLGAA